MVPSPQKWSRYSCLGGQKAGWSTQIIPGGVGQTTDRIVGQTTDRIVGKTTDRIVGQTTDRIVGQTTDRIVGQTTDRILQQTLVYKPWPIERHLTNNK